MTKLNLKNDTPEEEGKKKDSTAPVDLNAKKTWKTRSAEPVDMEKLTQMDNIKDKIYYLATCGWRIEMEKRNNNDYLYAIRYIDRKKRRIYLGKAEEPVD